jgi:hypothetical protein
MAASNAQAMKTTDNSVNARFQECQIAKPAGRCVLGGVVACCGRAKRRSFGGKPNVILIQNSCFLL